MATGTNEHNVAVVRRVAWAERSRRPAHDLLFTPIGASWDRGDHQGMPPTRSRYLSQIAIALPRGHIRPDDTDIDYWVTVSRKVLQRGTRPPVSTRVRELLPDLDHVVDERAIALSVRSSDVDSSCELHPRWERPFWDAARRIAPRAAGWLIPQASLEALVAGALDPGIGRRWVDFLYAPPGRPPVVFEIDGAGHERRADADRARDRLLGDAGIRVLRSDGRSSLQSDGPMLTRIAEDEAALAGDDTHGIDVSASSLSARFALAVVEAVQLGLLPKGGPWAIEVEEPHDLIDAVAGPSLDPLRAISELWRLGVVPAAVQVNGRAWQLTGEPDETSTLTTRVPATLRIRFEPHTPYYAPLAIAGDVPEITIRPAGVPVDLEWLPGVTTERRALRLTPDTDLHLHLLLADIFGHSSFREGQLSSLRQALRGGDSVVLLPTGSGKSLIYQLAGLLMPGTTIVVDPLVSLIDDQEKRLIEDGIDRVAAIHASLAGGPDQVLAALEGVSRGEPLYLFVTPERFQSQRFRDQLREGTKAQLVNLAVIDEAHTVSEWGHDFRTSYLRLARNVRRLCRDARGVWPPVLALTGTAGPAVLRDVLRELEIDAEADGALQRPESHDRPNLHFHKSSGRESDWLELVRRAVTGLVPQALGVALEELGTPRGSDTFSGIVFCPWARGTHGVDNVRDAIRAAVESHGVSISTEVYSGKLDARARASAAAAFKANAVPLLVATKAFGMGIDKPNIRYTVHAGFPSSIEAFAQEAGRAGRDGETAVCFLTAALPTDEAARSLFERSIPSEERAKRQKYTKNTDGGDLKRQLYFHGNSFPGPEAEAELGIGLFRWLAERGGSPGGTSILPMRIRKGEKPRDYEQRKGRRDRALFRLASLGVVDDLTVDGPEYTVHFADYDSGSIDSALLSYLSRIEPGAEAVHRGLVESAPTDFDGRLASHLRVLADAVYRIVAAARLTAIENMYELARGPDDPEHIRAQINAYLGDGAAATILSEAVTSIDVPRFVASLELLPMAESEALVSASARQLESYPEHPLLWLATALGVAREPTGDEARFATALRRSLASFTSYGIDDEQAAAGMGWLVARLRTENGSRRWDWASVVLEAWDDSGLALPALEAAEDEALRLAREGSYRERELGAIIRRRMRRRARQAGALADRYAGRAANTQGGHG